jgi:hypothetical protein
VEQPEIERDHHPTEALHQVDMQAQASEAAERHEHHPIAAREQQQDRDPDERKEFLEERAPELEPYRRIERARGGPQAHVGREHAANPNDGAENMQGESECGHGRSLRLE